MGHYRNFKSVVYCVAQWADRVTEERLREELDFFMRYSPVDKVYLETYRGEFARRSQLEMIKRVLLEYGIEVSGGITTVTPDLDESDSGRKRIFGTFCYCNAKMRDRLREVAEYTASVFDEFIIDDFFFTQCTCDDCRREKGERSWTEFRLDKMAEVSRNLVLEPARKVNPSCRVIIKYPNWRESYQATGYNPSVQKDMFSMVYAGTETRHGAQQDQHLPRYLSYSMVRYMENAAPGRNGGGWFDPFECDRIDTYLEQMYFTAFSRAKEIMFFCWSALSGNRRLAPAGMMLEEIDGIMSGLGEPCGIPVYIPFNSHGDDHLEDYLGMAGIPSDPTPFFPEFSESCRSVFVTAAALCDRGIVGKLEKFILAGGNAVVTSEFIKGALTEYPEISRLTGITFSGRRLDADEFQVTVNGLYGRAYVRSAERIGFPLLEHRNNSTWSKLNGGHGDYHEGIILTDTYGRGRLTVLNLPDMPSSIKSLPPEVLSAFRSELQGDGEVRLGGGYGVVLFTYRGGGFGLYCLTEDGCAPVDFSIYIRGAASALERIGGGSQREFSLTPLYVKPEDGGSGNPSETVFSFRMAPGDFVFFRIKR